MNVGGSHPLHLHRCEGAQQLARHEFPLRARDCGGSQPASEERDGQHGGGHSDTHCNASQVCGLSLRTRPSAFDVLGANADADRSRGESLDSRQSKHRLKLPGGSHRTRIIKDLSELTVRKHLHLLRHDGWELAPLLNRSEYWQRDTPFE